METAEEKLRKDLIYNVGTLAQMMGTPWLRSIMRPHGKEVTLAKMPTRALVAVLEQWGHILPGFRRRTY